MSLIKSAEPDMGPQRANRDLDITAYTCPMTFVRTKLAIEDMAPGEVLDVRLNAGEPLENVPRSVAEMGHEVIAITPDADTPGVHHVRIRLK